MEEIRLILVEEKSTDNTKRFEEVPPRGTAPHVRKLYVSKDSLKKLGNPKGIEVIIRPMRKE